MHAMLSQGDHETVGPVEKVHFAIWQRANSSGFVEIAASKIWTFSTGRPFFGTSRETKEFVGNLRVTNQIARFPDSLANSAMIKQRDRLEAGS